MPHSHAGKFLVYVLSEKVISEKKTKLSTVIINSYRILGFTLLSQLRLITRKYFLHTKACIANNSNSTGSIVGVDFIVFSPPEKKCSGLQGPTRARQFFESRIHGDGALTRSSFPVNTLNFGQVGIKAN